MAIEEKPVISTDEPSFELVLDTVFERLREKYVQYSIRRIGEMEEELNRLEKELNEFIGSGYGKI